MGRILKGVIKKLVHTYQVAKWEMAECQGHPEKKSPRGQWQNDDSNKNRKS